MQVPSGQHIANAGVTIATATSLWTHAPEAITVTLGLLGITWYLIQIYEWLLKKKHQRQQIRQSATRVATAELEARHALPDDPSPPTN